MSHDLLELSDSPAPQPAPAPSPENPTPPAAPEKPADPSIVPPEPEIPAEVLYDLPDWRKVNAEGLQKELKDNFLRDYTRKSQELAKYKDKPGDINSPPIDKGPAWKDPNFEPKSIAEIIEFAKAETIREIQDSSKAEQDRVKGIHDAVEKEISELQKIDPKLDQNALFQHANKYGFSSLKAAHENMNDMKGAALDAEQRTIKNLKTRETDPVSSAAGGGTQAEDGYDPAEMSQYSNAREFLTRVRGK